MWRCVFVLLLGLCACSAGNSDNATSRFELTVNESPVAFLPTFPSRTRTKLVTLTNAGQLAMDVSAASVPSAPFAVAFAPALPVTLAPHATVVMTITFSPAAEGSFSSAIVLNVSNPERPLFTVPLSGTGSFGTITQFVVGGMADFSRPNVLDVATAVLSNAGPDGLPGTADDRIVAFRASPPSVLSLALPAIAQQVVLSGANHPNVVVATGGPDAAIGTADDTLVLVGVHSGTFTTTSATVGALTANAVGRPLVFTNDMAVAATAGPDLVFRTADDTLAVVKFSPLTVTHATVGPIDASAPSFAVAATAASPVITFGGAPDLVVGDWLEIDFRHYRITSVGAGTATIAPSFQSATGAYAADRQARLSCRPHSAADGTVAIAGPGADAAFGTADDTVSVVSFDINTGGILGLSTSVVGALDPVVSEVRVYRPDQAVQARPGIDGLLGTADDVVVGFSSAGTFFAAAAPSIAGPIEILSQPKLFFGHSELGLLGAGADGTTGTADDEFYYLTAGLGSGELPTAFPFPNAGSPFFSRIHASSTSDATPVDPNKKIAPGTQVHLLSCGPDGIPRTADDRLVFLDVTETDGDGPIVATPVTVGPMTAASVPALIANRLQVLQTGTGPDGLPLTADDRMRVSTPKAVPPDSLDGPALLLDSGPGAETVALNSTAVLVVSAGPDGVMGTADDRLVHVVPPPP